MSLLSELLDRLWPRYHEHGAIASARAGRVVITGVIESLEDGDALACPLSGELAVVVHYVARTRGMSSRAYGIAGDALDIVRRAHEGRDFLLRDSSGAALILVDAGEDVLRLHDTLFEQHGLSLEPDTELV
ncbi:MAG: hypothetical protein KC468_01615, partial [Myxococcales bacterium]|nr:hypothetical protein [Myxococcales bacterium]